MPHSPESDEVIRWIVKLRGSEVVMMNHLQDLSAIHKGDKPSLETKNREFTDMQVSVRIRYSSRKGNTVVYLSGTNTGVIQEVKDFFVRHKVQIEFRDP